jgi:hypothetical protein
MHRRNGGQPPARRTLDSDEVARRINEACEDDNRDDVGELLGETDCPHGCHVEPEGRCPHGWLSAALTAGVI